MVPAQFAQFFALQGYRTVRTPAAFWYEIHPFCFQSLPYHRLIEPTAQEIRDLFYKHKSLLIRYFSPKASGGPPGYLWVCGGSDYNLAALGPKCRNQVRRGLEKNQVRRIDFETLAREGWDLIADTAARQRRNPDFSQLSQWVGYCRAGAGIPDFEAWGAFAQERLVAFLVGAQVEDHYYILQQASQTSQLENRPNNALIYTVTREKLADAAIRVVSYGIYSLEEPPGLTIFKKGMGFRTRPMDQQVLINPWFAWLKHKKVISAVTHLTRLIPKNNYLRKAAALLNLMAR